MPYRFEQHRLDYADYAGGRVFYSRPGMPAFPVRLACEMFQRALAVRAAAGMSGPVILYDPCCGGAYHLATLASLHRESLAALVGSDADVEALALARRNLALLTPVGMQVRIAELTALWEAYGKPAHAEALASARRLAEGLAQHPIALPTHLFAADALAGDALRAGFPYPRADLVLSDVPYGLMSAWRMDSSAGQSTPPLAQMLAALYPLLAPGAVVAIAADKAQWVAHPAYRRAGRFQIGKRRVTLLQPETQ